MVARCCFISKTSSLVLGKALSQIASVRTSDAAISSAVVDEVTTVCCRCDAQDTGLPGSVKILPEVDFPCQDHCPSRC